MKEIETYIPPCIIIKNSFDLEIINNHIKNNKDFSIKVILPNKKIIVKDHKHQIQKIFSENQELQLLKYSLSSQLIKKDRVLEIFFVPYPQSA